MSPASDAQSATVSVAEAAQVLGVTPSRVFGMLNSPDCILTGPPPPGRGYGRVREVSRASLEELIGIRSAKGRKTRHRRAPELLAEVLERLEALEAQVAAISPRTGGATSSDYAEKDSRIRALEYALAKSNAAADALRDAAAEERAAATARDVASRHERRARNALRRAEKARDDAVQASL